MKIAVIGAWHVHTQEYAQAILKNPQAQLACLWDDDQARGQAMAQTLGVPFQPDLEAIWADSSIQGIQVTTATNQHKEVLLAAAKAGKHIFTEKVLALTNEAGADALHTRVDTVLTVPEAAAMLLPQLGVISLKLWTYHTALERVCVFDTPRTLPKSVTVE